MGIKVPNRNNKWLYTVVSLIGNAAGKYNSMRSLNAKIAGPELCCFDRRRVDDELFCLEVVCGGSFEASDIRSVAKLCLGIAANDFPVVDQRSVIAGLLFTSELRDCHREHLHV